ncbi:CaiB/BaiF CoA-transferase family protein [Dactylosporangium sp. NPDC049742]|uniref:CaiB/BaiF CoA transferase family protein n=1 Tax=Dactylosporangium sp. NPDC049742 TaxID=3154737 RepID=UPI0034224B2D
MSGPLHGVRVIEVAALGPVPFAGMLLADMGAEVIRVDRVGAPAPGAGARAETDPRHRHRRTVALDLKRSEGVDLLLRLVAGADVLMEGMRPGVMERLGAGPQPCLDRNPGLIYARMTGWGQDGPLAQRAGHDINYIGIAGVLHPMGPAELPPPVPLNLVGDFGGGALYLAFGIACALREREISGTGQVIDAAMVDGAVSLTAMFHGMLAAGTWSDRRESNVLDGGAPFYRTYRTSDGGFMAVGAIEPQFYAQLLSGLELAAEEFPQHDRERWPAQAAAFARIFATRSRDEWTEAFDGTDACVTPVLSMAEAAAHPHLAARRTLVPVAGAPQPAPAPRFSRTAPVAPGPPVGYSRHTDELLGGLGLSTVDIERLRADRIVG